MQFLLDMWLPILVSGVLVWIAGFLMWMLLGLHKNEWLELPDERGFMGAMLEMGVKPGQYAFPFSDNGKRMKDPEFQERMNRGPLGYARIWPGPPNMGLFMAGTLAVNWVIAVFVAYIGSLAAFPESPYLAKFRVIGATAVAIYTLGRLPNDIWFRTPPASVGRNLFEGVVYGLLTAGTFAWLWK